MVYSVDHSPNLPLYKRFPELCGRLPWVPLTETLTPIHRLQSLGQRWGMSELWIKRDDLSALDYGGNKPRKLEFIVGHALSQKAKTLITFGAWGSHHALATALAARKYGLQTICVLVAEPMSEHLQHNLQCTQALSTQVILVRGEMGAAWAAIQQLLYRCIVDRGTWPYVIWPGGSTPRGSLGYVNAALELADQMAAGECPVFDEIYVPVGSNGTLAGLLVGCRIAGINSRLVGVKVSDYSLVQEKNIAHLANRCLGVLEHTLQTKFPFRISAADVVLEQGFLGAGYAHPTPEGQRAIEQMETCEHIPLEAVYTAKTVAAIADASHHSEFQTKRVLFWNTFNSRPFDFLDPL